MKQHLPPFPTWGGKQLWGDVFLFAGYRIQEHYRSGRCRLLDPSDIRLAGGTYDDCHEAFAEIQQHRPLARTSRHLVLLLHGLFRSKDVFSNMRYALRRGGYESEVVNYPSTRRTLKEHASQISTIIERSEDIDTVSFGVRRVLG